MAKDIPSKLLKNYAFFQKVIRTGSVITVSAAAISNEYQLLSNNSGAASFVQTAVPVFGIIDSVFGLMNNAIIIGQTLTAYHQNHLRRTESIFYFLSSFLGIYGNTQLFDKAITTLNNPLAMNSLYAGFAIKYGIDFFNALTNQLNCEWKVIQIRATGKPLNENQIALLEKARFNTLQNGFLFAGFLAIALGHPIGFVLLAGFMIAKTAYYGPKFIGSFFQNQNKDVTSIDPHLEKNIAGRASTGSTTSFSPSPQSPSRLVKT